MSLRWDEARGLVGETFELKPGGDAASVPVVVASAERRGGAGPVQFAVVFEGPREPLLPQRTYRFVHARLGERDIFITPIARTASAIRYEACFAHDP